MASEALEDLIAGMRAGGPDFAGDPLEARQAFAALLETMPVADDLSFAPVDLDGVAALHSPTGERDSALLYLHGGAYVVGSAQGYRGLAAELGRSAGAETYAIDYRLAPEHVFPAAVEDAAAAYRALLAKGVAPQRIVLAGDSAGGGLALATLVMLRDTGAPLPAAALLISPWADLTCTGATLASKAADDPSLTAAGLRAMAGHYLGDGDARDPLASPVCGSLGGLPPLLVQVGSSEILLGDAVRIAENAGAAGTAVQLEIWPEMIHVWHAFHFMLPEGRAAIDAAGAFLRKHAGR